MTGAREHLDVISSEDQKARRGHQRGSCASSARRLQLVPVDVQLLIAEVIALVDPDARRNGIALRSEVPDGLPELRADPALLRQARLNLALNASQPWRWRQIDDGAKVEKIAVWRSPWRYRGLDIGGQDRSDFRPVHTRSRRQRYRAVDRHRIVQLHGGESRCSRPRAGHHVPDAPAVG